MFYGKLSGASYNRLVEDIRLTKGHGRISLRGGEMGAQQEWNE
jgi:hypothetical protein